MVALDEHKPRTQSDENGPDDRQDKPRRAPHESAVSSRANMQSPKTLRERLPTIPHIDWTASGSGHKDYRLANLKRLSVFHNHMRPHMALGGKTPAEAAGIEVNGDNKWLTLIQNAQVSNRGERNLSNE